MVKLKSLLSEGLLDSVVLGNVIYANAKKTTKLGGKISMSIKSNRKTTAHIHASVYYDPDSNAFPKITFFDKEKYPNLQMVNFDIDWDNNANYWKVNHFDNRYPEAIKATNTTELKSGKKYTDKEMAFILTNFFNSIK
jgi:hypothetical protein